ncbi:MAG: ATP-binding protein [Deltaproteobacteria bacterium]|nr:ATP-binding protein [Deltaproteobacteria bacterium]
MYKRIIHISLPERSSRFLWGPRQTGKSTLLQERYPTSKRYDLLLSDEYRRLMHQPSLLREECLALARRPEARDRPVVVDEFQKVPDLLDEIHWLIENTKLSFILCGSSARKMKRGHANLLGGRAIRYELFPLVFPEIPDFSLEKALNDGLLPPHYGSHITRKRLEAYVGDYLQEEIAAEAATRNVPSFSRFLEIAAMGNGEMIQFNNIARECGVSAPTVKSYYQILVDTLLGKFVPAYQKGPKRRVILAPRFYFFDVGVVGFLTKRGRIEMGSELFGRAFEHFLFMELSAYASYSGLHYSISYWRTASQLEVDFILGDHEVVIEVKGTSSAQPQHLKGLIAFGEEYRSRRRILVSCDPQPRSVMAKIEILPWKTFLEDLWSGKIIW